MDKGDLLEVFEDIFSNCDVLISSLQKEKDSSLQPCEQDFNEFQSNFESLSKVLSHEATKFAIAHSSPPLPEVSTTQSLAGSLCNATSQLVGCYLLLPNTCGSTFLQLIQKELESLILGVKHFVETIQNLILKNDKLQPCLLSTGVLWEFCDRLPTLPKNNKEAVSSVLSREEQLINDAIEELEEAANASINDDEIDSDDETTIRGVGLELHPSVRGLVKTAAALIRRTKKLISDFNGVDQNRLDPIVEQVSTMSTEVDDLICSLYPPVNIVLAVGHGNTLSSKMDQLLKIVQGIAGEDDQAWIELLSKAVQHNLQNLQSKASST
uniref:Cyclin-D1-binding protein 1-like N-terminal domain-containing protein n=1 Tax=Daphnia galeata TaxID=27404 RepID=A0A8J2RQF7_9CRUS|nr:unnamed protein product [Daphnia galeata]